MNAVTKSSLPLVELDWQSFRFKGFSVSYLKYGTHGLLIDELLIRIITQHKSCMGAGGAARGAVEDHPAAAFPVVSASSGGRAHGPDYECAGRCSCGRPAAVGLADGPVPMAAGRWPLEPEPAPGRRGRRALALDARAPWLRLSNARGRYIQLTAWPAPAAIKSDGSCERRADGACVDGELMTLQTLRMSYDSLVAVRLAMAPLVRGRLGRRRPRPMWNVFRRDSCSSSYSVRDSDSPARFIACGAPSKRFQTPLQSVYPWHGRRRRRSRSAAPSAQCRYSALPRRLWLVRSGASGRRALGA